VTKLLKLMSECTSTFSGQATVIGSHTSTCEFAVVDASEHSLPETTDISNTAAMANIFDIVSAERWSSRGRAISFKHRRTSHHAKHATAARVQRFVRRRANHLQLAQRLLFKWANG
jgi:hypothetical protein